MNAITQHPIAETFGYWTVLALAPKQGTNTFYVCRCRCGHTKEIGRSNLLSGRTKSCGCKSSSLKGAERTPEYGSWKGMKGRCTNVENPSYENYGGRGIQVCDRWAKSYKNFLQDVGPRPSPQHSLDRIDNDGHYEPGNVRWATDEEQSNNQRKNIRVQYRGADYTMAELCRHLKLNDKSFWHFYRKRSLSLNEAILRAKKVRPQD